MTFLSFCVINFFILYSTVGNMQTIFLHLRSCLLRNRSTDFVPNQQPNEILVQYKHTGVTGWKIFLRWSEIWLFLLRLSKV